MTSLLILSFSSIVSDARVLKQVGEFTPHYEVTTCSYGPAPEGVVDHIRIPDDLSPHQVDWRLMFLRAYYVSYWKTPAVRFVKRALRGRRFDVILANDLEAAPIAVTERARRGVHLDLHEYTPLWHEEIPGWLKRRAPYYAWQVRRYGRRARSSTTVGRGIAQAYAENFGLAPEVVTNAAPYLAVEPAPARTPIRLVHSGVCQRNRALMETVSAVVESRADVTLDLYLTPNDPPYLAEIRQAAEASGGRVTVHEPVPYEQLNETLQQYDLGVVVIPPVNFNYRWGLPNKLFDYVQARLGVIVGPSPEMEELVVSRGIGAVTGGYDAADVARTLDELTPAAVDRWKAESDRHAAELSAGPQIAIWRRAIDRLAGRSAP